MGGSLQPLQSKVLSASCFSARLVDCPSGIAVDLLLTTGTSAPDSATAPAGPAGTIIT